MAALRLLLDVEVEPERVAEPEPALLVELELVAALLLELELELAALVELEFELEARLEVVVALRGVVVPVLLLTVEVPLGLVVRTVVSVDPVLRTRLLTVVEVTPEVLEADLELVEEVFEEALAALRLELAAALLDVDVAFAGVVADEVALGVLRDASLTLAVTVLAFWRALISLALFTRAPPLAGILAVRSMKDLSGCCLP